MNVMNFYSPTRVIAGVGAHEMLPTHLKSFGANRIFMVLDPAVLRTEISERVQAVLREKDVPFAVFAEVEPDPSDTTVEKAIAACKSFGADGLLAIGGGSTVDVAKAVGIVITNGGRIRDYEGIEVFSKPPLPLIAIPTTAGTGSEVSGSCVITDTERHLKMSIRHATLNPSKLAILDPIALKTLPADVAAHAGMDAFVHAFESYISRQATPFTDALNLQALELIAASIRTFVADRTNLEAGLNMLVGSTLAGMAFGLTGLGNVHCMARFVGAYFHVSHGLSNALCLPTVAKFNRPAAISKYARVAIILGGNISSSEEQNSEIAVERIARLCTDLNLPRRLRDVGANAEAFPEMAALCVEAGYDRWNPRKTNRDDFLRLFEEAY